tara:strand:+ start:158 stop:490 length:333 start_codon:yes stop_codon:yes gene_type:complete
MKLGDCFEVAVKYMMDEGLGGDLTLVHAEVIGQGSIDGIQYAHAFCVDSNDTVIDKSNGGDLRLPKPLYYAVGGIYAVDNYHEYSYSEMIKMCMEYEHYGPWDLKTSTGL